MVTYFKISFVQFGQVNGYGNQFMNGNQYAFGYGNNSFMSRQMNPMNNQFMNGQSMINQGMNSQAMNGHVMNGQGMNPMFANVRLFH